ncbi:hypothetical protein LshimejAT787_1000120 [Lyophyllum shimeji]|uniref:Uncharacterized protein n=1 Tax=Lyophyllum shimeji TaxID=47721 RepID=A0A9P3UQM5_LYOSH|nr:hypothetical protein LshimejAT787_1000120 [Lyophyllum shimeji]
MQAVSSATGLASVLNAIWIALSSICVSGRWTLPTSSCLLCPLDEPTVVFFIPTSLEQGQLERTKFPSTRLAPLLSLSRALTTNRTLYEVPLSFIFNIYERPFRSQRRNPSAVRRASCAGIIPIYWRFLTPDSFGPWLPFILPANESLY